MKKIFMLLVTVLLMIITGCGDGDDAFIIWPKAITSFSLDGVAGTINEAKKTIEVTMPFGTVVTALTPIINQTGKSIIPEGAQNFSSPVTYTVTAIDGTSVTYTASVTFATPVGKLPRTGQTTSYATGDDGNLQMGIAWPIARFTDGTGAEAECITDNLTGLMWAKNANLAYTTWWGALNYIAATMNGGGGFCGHNDWRLPNIKELRSLANYSQASTATWLQVQGFINVQTNWSWYWVSTTAASDGTWAWLANT